MKPRICPLCKSYMNNDEDGYWCSNEECEYEIVLFNTPIRREE